MVRKGLSIQLYLSAILDLYDRSIVAYVVSKRNDNKLVFDTFEQATSRTRKLTRCSTATEDSVY